METYLNAVSQFLSGDVSVVGALGDFVAAGSGSLASRITDAGREFRGASFATGEPRCIGTLEVWK